MSFENTRREEWSDTDGVKQSRSCQQFGVFCWQGDALLCNTRFPIPFFQELFVREHKYLNYAKWKHQEMAFLFFVLCYLFFFPRTLLLPRLNWCGMRGSLETRTSLEDFAEEFFSTFKCYDSLVVPKSFILPCPGTPGKKNPPDLGKWKTVACRAF